MLCLRPCFASAYLCSCHSPLRLPANVLSQGGGGGGLGGAGECQSQLRGNKMNFSSFS